MLLKKANTITTPTAYSNGFLHSVKPEVVLGEELVVNGTFDTNSDWAKGPGWTISGGKANCDGTQTALSALAQYNLPIYAGDSLEFTFQVTRTAGTISYMYLGGTLISAGINENGTYTYSVNYTSAQTLQIVADANFIGSIDNVSVKKKLDADFTFTRNSSATRVNELGYIEDVQIIGGELVSNGDFEEIGSELVTNGSFSDGLTNWSVFGGDYASVVDGVLNSNNPDNGSWFAEYIGQDIAFVSGKIYKVAFSARNISGSLILRLTQNSNIIFNANLTAEWVDYVVYYTANANNGSIRMFANDSVGQFEIDNVSVKEVGQDWTFSTGWTYEDGKAVCDGTNAGAITQNNVTEVGKKYRITYEIKDYVSGYVRYRSNLINGLNRLGNGIYTEDIVVNSTTFSIQSLSFIGSIDNISVKEVTDDTNLPRINYEGFTYENGLPVPYSGKGHLLLEGQRTNKMPYSEYFEDASFGYASITLEGGYLAPDGTNSAYKITATNPSTAYLVYGGISLADDARTIYARSVSGTGTAQLLSHNTNTNNTFTLTEQWQRFELNSAPLISNNFYPVDFRGSGTLTEIIIWGAQLEEASYASSYIPTLYGTAVTRLGETCNNATHSYPSEGVLYAEIAALTEAENLVRIALSDGTNFNRIIIELGRIDNTSFRVYVIENNVTSVLFIYNGVYDFLNFTKIAVRYKENDFALWVNGVQVATNTSGLSPTGLTELAFDTGDGSLPFYGKTKMVATFPYLSNDEMECLTT